MLQEPNCSIRKCRWFRGVVGEEEANQAVVCKAFPEGIPFSISYGNDKHLLPVSGDHGIQYEKGEPGV